MGEYANRIMHQLAAKDPGSRSSIRRSTRSPARSSWPSSGTRATSDARIFERIVEPERVVMFRVPWVDDAGEVQVNRGFRVEMNSAIGPYKGGLRFHPTVYLGMLKFLAFEQVFKNSLTTLPLGAGKGGADFDPKGRSDGEVMRFCQSFMTELQRHIGQFTDVPAGDIGVGGREIGYLFGQYKRIRNEFTGVLTGKGLEWGGSLIRPEATGYGTVYFAEEMAEDARRDRSRARRASSRARATSRSTRSRSCSTSARKPVTLSDSGGFIYDKDGIDREKLAWVMDLKERRRGRIMQYAEQYPSATFTPVDPSRSDNPLWAIPAEAAFPSATQNEINAEDAGNLLDNGVYIVAEGANMPTEPQGVERFVDAKILYGPGKAANAGGVAVSGLEMSQNSERRVVDAARPSTSGCTRSWSRSTTNCRETAEEYDVPGNYVHGANIAGFRKVADAMLAQGIV